MARVEHIEVVEYGGGEVGVLIQDSVGRSFTMGFSEDGVSVIGEMSEYTVHHLVQLAVAVMSDDKEFLATFKKTVRYKERKL